MELQEEIYFKKNMFSWDYDRILCTLLSIRESSTSLSCNSVHLRELIKSSNYIIAGNLAGQVNKILPSLL